MKWVNSICVQRRSKKTFEVGRFRLINVFHFFVFVVVFMCLKFHKQVAFSKFPQQVKL